MRGRAVVLGLVLATSGCRMAAADDADFLSRVKADTEWLTGYGTRQVGTPQHARLQKDLLTKVQAIPNVEVWTHTFPALVPVYGETYLEVDGDVLHGQHVMFPIWPDVGRLNTTGEDGIRGRLVYVGDAGYERLPARGLQGNIAVVEMAAYKQYRRAFDYGAKAVIFVASGEPGEPLPSNQSLYKPRYYVEPGPLADALRAGDIAEGRIVCHGDWKTVTAQNIYAAVQPPDAVDRAPYAVVAPYDAMSRVAGIAPGADAAVDCAVVLNLLREQARAAMRPLLFGFVDAYHINQLGMRYMAAMANVTPDGRTRREYREIEQENLAEYREAVRELEQFDRAEDGIDALHDRYGAKQLRRLFKDAAGPALLRLRELLGDLRLAAQRTENENTPVVRDEVVTVLEEASEWLLAHHASELSEEGRRACREARQFVAAELEQTAASGDRTPVALSAAEAAPAWDAFDEARRLSGELVDACVMPLRTRNLILEAAYDDDEDVADEHLTVARRLWKRMSDRVLGQLAEQERRLAFFEPMDQLRSKIASTFGRPDDTALCAFVVGLDLSDCGIVVGPGDECGYNRVKTTSRDFDRALKHAVKRGDLWPEGAPERRVVNIDAIEGRVGGAGFLGHRALITSAALSFELPGVTWVTDDAQRQRVDTPLDRYARLDWDRIAPQIPPTRGFLAWLLTTDEFTSDRTPVSETSAAWRHGMGRIVDVSAGETVPRVPRSGFLITLVGSRRDMDGIRCHEFTWTGEDGSFRLPILCAEIFRWIANFDVAAYKLNEQDAITESLSTTESLVTARLATSFSLLNKPGKQLPRAVTFDCVELNGPSFFDARFLEPLAEGDLLDAVRGGKPKQAQFSMDKTGQMWGLVEPETRWQLILRAGAGRVRLALLNALPDGRERGMSMRDTFLRGYEVDAVLPSIPAHLAARDISALNEWRLADFRAAGIESEKIDEIRVATREALDEADAAMRADNGAALKRAAVRALANEVRAYQAVKALGLDVSRGAIFLMLMLVPFCVAMERLLFACPRISGQITAALSIFAGMTALLWSFHPAFRISAQPLVIVMAFAILSLSVIVIAMVLQRFKGSVRELQSALAEASGAKMGRGGLVGSAIFLGIANMRKRKVRTLLTGSTVVLVTFALLCFSSASSYLDKRDFRLDDVETAHSSVLVRRPSFGPLQWPAVPVLHNLLRNWQRGGGNKGTVVGERAWLAGGRGDTSWRMYVIDPATGKQAPVRGALGLPPTEDRLTGVDRVLTDWATFAREGGCYLSADTAQRLGVSAGDPVVVRGRELVVRGVFDPIRLEDDVALLDGQRITPYDYTQLEQDWVNRDTQDAIEQETGSAAAMQPGGDAGERHIPARELIVLPAELVREFEGALHSFGIACRNAEQAAAVAHELTETVVYPAYYSNGEGGVNVVAATPLMAVPPKNLLIPLTIAALIIFTTMLNSVSERRGEIYVYTSLGLAPTHVGALFVAEALTYGLMGAVLGYIAGQGAATLLTSLGYMEGVTLNYSGTAVIKTMLLVQGVVVLSAIVPAVVAGRIAAPSTEMDWQVPEPVDGVIRDVLPFTVSPSAAAGLVAFIHEYLEAHRDGVLGGFDVDRIQLLTPGDGGCVAGLGTRLWLEPYDMGVRQWMRLSVEPPEDGACPIAVAIHHEAGTPKVWWRLNKPFFFELRRQLLGWRKLSPERIQKYIDSAAKRGVP